MNVLKFRARLMEEGLTLMNAADTLGCSCSTLSAKIHGNKGADLRLREVKALRDWLGLSDEEVDDIFFT